MIFQDFVQAICWQEHWQPLTFSNWKCQGWGMREFFFLRIFSTANIYFCLFSRIPSHSECGENHFFEEFILKSANITKTDFELLSNSRRLQWGFIKYVIHKIDWTLKVSSNSYPKIHHPIFYCTTIFHPL